jgi:hypothetical protein
LTPEERQERLAVEIARWVAVGRRLNHVLHLILTVLTLGLWLVLWSLLGLFGGEKREVLRIDEWGNPSIEKLG